MIRTLLTTPEGETHEGDERLITLWQSTPGSHIWIDMQGEPQESERAILEAFEFHPMAIQDAHKERHPPKIEQKPAAFCDSILRMNRQSRQRKASALQV